MKTTFLFMLLITLFSCQNVEQKENESNKEDSQEVQLNTSEETTSMNGLEITEETVTKDWNGEVISKEKFYEYLKGGEYIYAPKVEDGKLVEAQLQKPSKEQMELKKKMMSESDQDIEKSAPDFEVKDINGNTYKLSSLKDKTVVLNFWFTACKPCISEMPLLNDLVQSNPNTIFIAFAPEKEKQIKDFLKTQSFDYNIVADARAIAKEYNVSAYPTHYVIKNGVIKSKFVGFSPNIQTDLQAAIDGKMLAEESSKEMEMKEPIILNSDSDIRTADGKKLNMMEAVKMVNTQEYTMENAKDESGKAYILIKKL